MNAVTPTPNTPTTSMRQNPPPEPLGSWWICNDDPTCEGKALIREAGMAFVEPRTWYPPPVLLHGPRSRAERYAQHLLGLDREEWELGGYYLARPWRMLGEV